MARRPSRQPSSSGPLTKRSAQPALPRGPIETDSGSVELVPDRDDPRALTVMINGVPSSFIDLDDPRNVGFEYMDIMCAVLDHTRTGPLDVVHLGTAGCAMARSIDATRPGSRQIGIDIDARLIDLARTWFDLPRSPRLRLRSGDARAQLATLPTASSDVVIRDVFAGDTTPAHLLTVEFVTDVLRVLRPGGIYLINCADRPPLDGARSEVATLRAALDAASPASASHASTSHAMAGLHAGTTRTAGSGDIVQGGHAAGHGSAEVPGEIGIISEPALLKSRRYGNLVLVLIAPSSAEADAGQPGADGLLGSAGLARALRTLAVPAQIMHTESETGKFAGQARVLRDAATPQTSP